MRRLILAIALLAASLHAGDAPPRSILIVFSDQPGMPAVAQFTNALTNALKDPDPAAIAIYTEHLDLGRLGDAVYSESAIRWLKDRYANVRLDVVVAGATPALKFLLAHRTQLWPTVPIVFAEVARPAPGAPPLPPNVTGLYSAFDFEATLDFALRLFPRTCRVAVVTGSSQRDQIVREQTLPMRGKYPGRLEWEDLQGLTAAELKQRLAALPHGTIVIWTVMNSDADGKTYIPREALAFFSPSSSAPIFSPVGSFLGAGIVGGKLVDFNLLGKELAEIVSQVLKSGSASQIPPVSSHSQSWKFDWRQLRKWGISEASLPPGSEVQFRVPTYWEDHKLMVLAWLAFALVETTLIAFLLLERRRRAAYELALRRLSGQLITAQEQESRRIARDLHDDVNQRLALLSIELDQLGEADGAASVRPRLRQLATKMTGLATEIHTLARELHPAKLEHLGLIPSARDFCRELELRHEIEVEFQAGELPEALPADTAICLYRVLQEALRNVVLHSGAPRASVSIGTSNGRVVMRISDKGSGFAAGDLPKGPGLGLVGMRERVALVGGDLTVHSTPGAGTEVIASVPIPNALGALS